MGYIPFSICILTINYLVSTMYVIFLQLVMIMIAPNSRTREKGKKRREVKGQYGTIWGEKKGNADNGGMVQPCQQHVAPSVMGLSGDWAREVSEYWWIAQQLLFDQDSSFFQYFLSKLTYTVCIRWTNTFFLRMFKNFVVIMLHK